MKHYRLYLPLLALILAIAPVARGQWLTHTPDNSHPPGTATTAAFPSALSGSVTSTIRILQDGLGNGVPGISPNPFTNITPTFLSYFPLNPGNTFDFLNLESNDTGDAFKLTINFAGLQGGVLPVGSVIAFLDVDNFEQISTLDGFGPSGPYATPWLQQFTTNPPSAFDYDNASGDSINPALAAGVGFAAGNYFIGGATANQDSAFQGFTTTQNLKSISLIYLVGHNGGGVAAFNSLGVAIEAVPEPNTLALAALGGTLSLLGSRRRIRRFFFALKDARS